MRTTSTVLSLPAVKSCLWMALALTPLGCAVGGAAGRWKPFSDATIADWQRAADVLREYGGRE